MLNSILRFSQLCWSSAQPLLRRHGRWLGYLTASVVVGATGGAWALVSLGPDVDRLPVQNVIEAVQTPLTAEHPELIAPALNLYRSDLSRSTDTADTLLVRLGVQDLAAAQFLRRDPLVRQHLLGRPGRNITVQTADARLLDSLTARWSADDSGQFRRLVVKRQGAAFTSRLESAALESSTRLASGSIESSLFAATDAAGLPDTVATQLAEIFSGDIDFRRALRKGDRFNVVYEVLQGDGEPLRSGRVLSAEFVNAGKTFQAMWFQSRLGSGQAVASRGGYYSLNGQSLRRAFLSSPVQFSRVSSGFANRFHPILKQWRKHLGTDFAAPTGTPARTVGDGVVSFAGVQNGYGNVVFIKHRNNTETVYAHLNRLLVRRGQNVGQGDTIGLVGSTGWATGPHLHFEVRVNGVQHNPMALARRSETVPVPAAELPAFHQLADHARAQLQVAASVSAAHFE
ncbi:MAG: peptidase M23 [Comamonadaceae bacterium CG1_02_60_18]|nr:MAG: peptidase M23 [Comamonadaceae bacterium CG1_02_60_18]PIQ53665.1 MAG: peptidase M23 [Comamonadaceae bacterium CG12_big_fil_rev_8_21_14_0_65_59_15]